MKQLQFTFRDNKTLDSELQKLRQLYEQDRCSAALIHLFTELPDPGQIDQVCRRIEELMPEALYAGCSTYGNIIYGEFSAGAMVLVCTLFEFPTSRIHLFSRPLTEENQLRVAEALAAELEQNLWVKGVELLATGRSLTIASLCESLSRLRDDLQIFGGCASRGEVGEGATCVFSKSGGYTEHGIVFILYGGKDFFLETSFVTGWKPLGSFLDVTSAEGTLLRELNGRPAYDTYYKYLHIQNDENFYFNTLEFPFLYRQDGIDIMRTPTTSNPDGSLTITAAIPEGVQVRIAYGDPWTILESVWQEGRRLLEFAPECIHVFSCSARRTFWGDADVGRETEPYQLLAPTSGFYTAGEFLRTNGYVNQHNVTQVLVVMREGKARTHPGLELTPPDHSFAGRVSMINRLATFIRVTTEELERKTLENERLISATEYDDLTGLYNRSYFYEFANRFYREHPDKPADAVVINIDQFHSVNELHGRDFGDKVLRTLGKEILVFLNTAGGIGSRLNVDDYYFVCTPQEDYQALLDSFQSRVNQLSDNAGIRLRMGVMPWKKDLEPVQLLDRAHTACQRVRFSDRHLVIYDEKMLEREHLNERLLNDLDRALREHEFKVYYQPKFNITVEPPVLSSAEALVRWDHPELGMIAPNMFIPLFEENGLIQQVDRYVWREVASQLAAWREKFGRVFPVSVNVSRIDLYDPDFNADILKIIKEYGIRREDFLLEITESAYTEDSEQIVENVRNLREAGFMIEMDDFGSGYSSLNMISTLPVDVIKLDMQFIRSAFQGHSDTRMLEAVLGIADMLYLPTVAEGVETVEQLNALKSMGCDAVQGYYFSKPVPAEQYEVFIEQRMSLPEDAMPADYSRHMPRISYEDHSYDELHDPLTGVYSITAFNMLVKDADHYHTALLLAEVVGEDQILSRQGQITAELVLKNVADLLKQSFRPIDHICRISNSQFAIVMSRVDSSIQEQVSQKFEHINEILSKPDKKTPVVSLAVGVAFADRFNPGNSIMEDAKAALSGLKARGETGCAFH